jgi:hypothetical protein
MAGRRVPVKSKTLPLIYADQRGSKAKRGLNLRSAISDDLRSSAVWFSALSFFALDFS